MGAPGGCKVASLLNRLLLHLLALQCPRYITDCRGNRLPRSERGPGSSLAYHARGLDDPGIRLMFAAEARHCLLAAARLGHLDVKDALAPRNHAIGGICHA